MRYLWVKELRDKAYGNIKMDTEANTQDKENRNLWH